MKVLVTGGAGFIGSNIVDKLIAKGVSTVAVDNLSTGKKKNVNGEAVFYNADLLDKSLANVFEKERPTHVIHQAAQVSVIKSVEDPVFDSKINLIGSLRLLEQCRKHKIKKIVYANSGGAISGEPKYFPVDEKHPINPICPYGVSKQSVEDYLKIYHMLYGIKYTSLRYSNVYGPRQDPFGEGGVVAIFCNSLKQGKAPNIFGNGKQTRDFIFVGDVSDANLFSLDNLDCDHYNVCSGTETSVNELYSIISGISGKYIRPRYVKERKGEIFRSVLSPEKISKKGWKPKVSLKEGLEKTYRFFAKSLP